ncbi:PhoH-like protein [gamma proteobacterium HdN1]|nr:PhoH-like protein [gamma proteobacterium HdN1]
MNAPSTGNAPKGYILDTNVLIHDPSAILNFEEHLVVIPMTVLEELDMLKNSSRHVAAECRAAIRLIDQVLRDEPTEQIRSGVPIYRGENRPPSGFLAIMMNRQGGACDAYLPENNNDNRIINRIIQYQEEHPQRSLVLVSKDINMRLKARACSIEAQDYHNDQLVDDVTQLNKGYVEVEGSFWDGISQVDTATKAGVTYHELSRAAIEARLGGAEVFVNLYLMDQQGFAARVVRASDQVVLKHLQMDALMHKKAWGLRPRNPYQAIALDALLDPELHLVTLTGPAGSGKTILALAAAIELTVEKKLYNKIVVTRSTPPLAEDHGFLPGTEEEKMDPWLGAITDNIEALHLNDEDLSGSVDYVRQRANIQFKALNYIRGRSFQRSVVMIDESQNLTPHQMKTIITRAGEGSKVVCLGNLAQIDTPYLSAVSSGLTYMSERFKGFEHSASVRLSGIPRSKLAEFAEAHL